VVVGTPAAVVTGAAAIPAVPPCDGGIIPSGSCWIGAGGVMPAAARAALTPRASRKAGWPTAGTV
jgi:hypothetical protein